MKRTDTPATLGFLLIALALLIPANAVARGPSSRQTSAASLAFARYIATIQAPSPFGQAEPVAVMIEASLPSLYKDSRVLALRKTDESGHRQYLVLQVEGDATVIQEVIAPYLAIEDHVESLPMQSVAITPANYRFRYMGEVGTESSSSYVFRITPRKKRDGLIQGELWIDATTGIGTVQTGRFVKSPTAFASQIQVVRDTTLLNGIPLARVTHMTIETRLAGRGELSITESRLIGGGERPELPGIRSDDGQMSKAPAVTRIH